MSDKPTPKKRPGPSTRPLGSGGLGKDQQDHSLQGIAPAVVDAFLGDGLRRRGEDSPETSGLFTAPAPEKPAFPEFELPRRPDSLGAFRAASDSAEVKEKFKKIQALAQAVREAPAAEAPPEKPPAPPTEPPAGTRPPGTGPIDPILAMRANRRPPGDRPKGPATGPLENPDVKLQHLAMRAKQKNATTRSLGKLERSLEAALGEKGAVKLRQSIKALEDKALPGKLSALAESVNKLLPEGSEKYVKLGAEVGKQVIQNNVNPVMAIGMALKEAHERLEQLEKWDELSNKERIANMAMLTSNLSEVLGAVTPPPVNYGIQVLGAGMLLMGLATEHSEVVEDLAKVAGGEKAAKAVSTGVDSASNQLASRVKTAWEELNDRLATKKKPRLPAGLQAVVDSPMWKRMKKHPVGARVAEGAENVMYNLARRKEAFTASWDHRLEGMKKKTRRKGGSKAGRKGE